MPVKIFKDHKLHSAIKLIDNKYLASFVITIAIAIICYLIVDKYRAEILSSKYVGELLSNYYHDLDNDRISERIEFHRYTQKMVSVLVYHDLNLILQNDFEGDFAHLVYPGIDDYDNDDYDEIILFTQFRDSLYLSIIDINSEIHQINKIPVCKVYILHGLYSYSISPVKFRDVNDDGVKEFFFSVNSGYPTRPRKMFSYYPAENKLNVSPESCAITRTKHIFDLDEDGIPEIFGKNQSTGNCSFERDYTDMYSWLMVFTPEMNFRYPPVIIGRYPSNTYLSPIRLNTNNYILAYHSYKGDEDIPDYLALFDAYGREAERREINHDENLAEAFLFTPDSTYNSVYIYNLDGEFYKIIEDLETEFVANIGRISGFESLTKDIDGDGNLEYIFLSSSKKQMLICRSDFSHAVKLSFPEVLESFTLSSTVNPDRKKPGIIVETEENSYTIDYDLTFIYKYWYFFILFIYTGCLLFIFLYQKVREYRIIMISHRRNQIIELQLKSIRNQIDPHFTLNLFQSFATLISEHDNDRAEFLFDQYAVILKTTVLNSEKLFIPLQEEMNFVTSYLDLEKFRQSDRFSYSINIPSSIDKNMQIPKMLLFIFVENSIKHGLKNLETGGKLIIKAEKNDPNVQISIIDNGVGREKAAEYATSSTGKGLKIIDQILELYYSMNRIRISYEIIDLMDDQLPTGTQVIIKIPV